MASSRIPVPLNDHQRARLEAWADAHGAKLGAAILALALRQLDAEDDDTAATAAARHNRSRRNVAAR